MSTYEKRANLAATQVTDDSGTLLATTVSIGGQWGVTTNNGVATGDGIMMNKPTVRILYK